MTRRGAVALLALMLTPTIGGHPATVRAAPASTVPVRHADYTYTVDMVARVIHVVADVRVANDSADGARACFTDFRLKVPATATGFRATNRSTVAPTDLIPAAPGATVTDLEVTLEDCLDYGRQEALKVTYDLPSGAARSNAPARIGDGYFAFLAWGAGRAGGTTITVVAPSDFTIGSLGADWRVRVEGATTSYVKLGVADPSTYQALIAGDDASSTTGEALTVDGARIEVRGWPGDDEWVQHTKATITAGLPALEAALGRPWPTSAPFVVREAYTPGGLGAVSWPTTPGQAAVGEQLDDRSVLRALAGAWFGSDRFADQWLAEGLADVHTDAALEALGGEPATAWYGASTAAVAAVVAEVGPEQMAAVLTALEHGDGAYGGDGPNEGPADWRRFLDLAEEVGGAHDAAALIQPALAEADQLLLADRDKARAQYAALNERGGEWIAPLGVRRLMEDWAFTEAMALIDDAEAALDERDALAELLADTNIAIPADLRTAYEAATTDLATVATLIDERADVAPVLVRAVRGDEETGGFIDWIGLLGSDADSALADARAAFEAGDTVATGTKAREAITATSAAGFAGFKRILLTGGVLLAGLVVALTVRSLLRRRTVATPAEEPGA